MSKLWLPGFHKKITWQDLYRIDDLDPEFAAYLAQLMPQIAGGAEISDALEAAILNKWLRNDASPLAVTTTVAVALHTADPTDAGSGAEAANSNGYARQVVTFGAPSGGVCANTNLVTFPVATPAGWGTVTHSAIWNSVTWNGGAMLFHSPLNASATINLNDVYSFPIGAITVTMA